MTRAVARRRTHARRRALTSSVPGGEEAGRIEPSDNRYYRLSSKRRDARTACATDQLSTVLEASAPLRLSVHDGFAWFLDSMTQRLGVGMPDLLFTQGCAAHPDNPGDMTPEQSVRLALALDVRDDNWIAAAMCAGHPGSCGDDLTEAVAFVRDLARLLHTAAHQGGLRVT